MAECLLSIRVKLNTMFSERVVLVGNENSLGSWNPEKGLNLSTNPCEYPQWFLAKPLKFPKGVIIQFKFLVMKDDQIIRWESLPGKKNRHYYVVHDHALLNCQEGVYEGQEIIPRPRFKKMRSEPSQENLLTSNTAQDFTTAPEITFTSSKSAEIAQSGRAATDSFESHDLGKVPKNRLLIKQVNFYPQEIANGAQSLIHHFLKDSNGGKTKKIASLSDLYENLMRRNPGRVKTNINGNRSNEALCKKPDELIQNIAYDEQICILTLFLPLKIVLVDPLAKDISKKYEISFIYDDPILEMEAFLFTRLLAHYKRLLWFGILKDFHLDDPKACKELSDHLLERYKCWVLWDMIRDDPWKTYYKKIWVPFMKNRLDLEKVSSLNQGVDFFRESIKRFQGWFFQNIEKALEENSLALIMDGFLGFLCEKLATKTIKVALYSNYGFPSIETMLLSLFSEEFTTNLLGCQVLVFNHYKEVKKLLNSYIIKRYSVKTEIDRGNLILSANSNRKIIIKSGFPGLDLNHLDSHIKKNNEYVNLYNFLVKDMKGKKSVLLLENLEDFKIIEQKLLFLKRFLIETGNKHHLKIFFLLKQKKNHTLQDELFNIKDLVNKINNTVFDNPYEYETVEDFHTIRLFEEPFTKQQTWSFMTLSSVFLVNHREECIIDALQFIALSETNGVCLFSEYFSFASEFNLHGSFSYNPFKYESFKEKMKHILSLDQEILAQISFNDKSLLRKNSLLSWFEGILLELKRTPRKSTFSEIVDQLSHQLNNNEIFTRIRPGQDLENLTESFRNSKNRLFIFETRKSQQQNIICGQTNENLRSNGKSLKGLDVLKTLEILSRDPKNSFFVISDESLDLLIESWNKLRDVGLLGEHGFFYRTDMKNPKGKTLFPLDFRWRKNVIEIMEEFKEKTEGVKIIKKNSYLVWNYEDCDVNFAKKQADELESLLKKTLEEELNKLEIIQNRFSVEVRPIGVNKAIITELLVEKIFIEKGKLDFMLNYEDMNKGNTQGNNEELMIDGFSNLLKHSPEFFEKNMKSFIWIKEAIKTTWCEDEDFLKVLQRFLTLYL